jgi:putative transposase
MKELYHVYNHSIEGMKIFTNNNEYKRFINAIRFYQIEEPQVKFSDFIETSLSSFATTIIDWGRFDKKDKIVKVIAYCVMPTHFHVILSQLTDQGIPSFVSNLLNSYARYFNAKYKRKGPLWQGRTKKILIDSDLYLLHLTRYIHLNPVTAYLVDKPEDWFASSYNEYLMKTSVIEPICDCYRFFDMIPERYKKFVEGGIEYQRERANAKNYSSTYEVG